MTMTSSIDMDAPDSFDIDRYMRQRFHEFFGNDLWGLGDWLSSATAMPALAADLTASGMMDSSDPSAPMMGREGQLMASANQKDDSKHGFRIRGNRALGGGAGLMPKLDIKEMADFYLIKVDLPGVKKENIHVYVDDRHLLHIEAELPDDMATLNEHEHMLLAERMHGTVSRQIRLPKNADDDQVETVYENGVLGLRFAKKQEVKKAIPVQ